MFEGVENMKKKILLFVAMCLLVLPITTKAISIDKYNTLNLKEALKEEEIDEAFKDYKENDKQVTIYLFRGKGCSFCRAFLTFLNSITDEYGKYFKVVSFEVWNDAENSALLSSVAAFMNKDLQGVPFIVIGDKVFDGYSSSYDEDIKSTIKDLYNSKDRYDVFAEMTDKDLEVTATTPETETTDGTGDATSEYSNTSSSKDISNSEVLLVTFLLFIINIIVIVAYVNYENKKVMLKLEEKSRR